MRKIKSLKNFLSDVIPYFVLAILGFVQIKVFIGSLGEEIYALNQLFIQLFSYISLVEGGVGAIIAQKYYKLFVDNDKEEINRMYTSSKKAMQKVSIVIVAIGFVLSFFLTKFTNNSLSSLYMQIVFMLYIIRSIIEYLNLSPRFVLQADQKIYKINLIINFFKFLEIIIEIGLLLLKVDYMVILVSSIFVRIIMYKFVNKKVFKEYPWLHSVDNSAVPKISGIGYMYFHKIAGAVYNNTDILLISAKMNPTLVTIYSTYNYIIRYLTDVIYMVGSAISASLGNVIYKEKSEKSFKIFEEINIFFLFCSSFFTTNVYLLADNFISSWLGHEYIISKLCLIFMCFILFSNISKRIFTLYVETVAKYKETKIIVALEAAINLILSLILIDFLGLDGVLLATVISYLITTFWYYPYYIFNREFKKNCGHYFIKYFITLLTTLVLSFLGSKVIATLNINSLFIWFLVAMCSCIVILVFVVSIFSLFFCEFRRFLKKIILMLRGK